MYRKSHVCTWTLAYTVCIWIFLFLLCFILVILHFRRVFLYTRPFLGVHMRMTSAMTADTCTHSKWIHTNIFDSNWTCRYDNWRQWMCGCSRCDHICIGEKTIPKSKKSFFRLCWFLTTFCTRTKRKFSGMIGGYKHKLRSFGHICNICSQVRVIIAEPIPEEYRMKWKKTENYIYETCEQLQPVLQLHLSVSFAMYVFLYISRMYRREKSITTWVTVPTYAQVYFMSWDLVQKAAIWKETLMIKKAAIRIKQKSSSRVFPTLSFPIVLQYIVRFR